MASEPRSAGLVCEGYTDVLVLEEMLRRVWPELDQVIALQPLIDELGKTDPRAPRGWTAVKTWCEQHADDLAGVLDPGVGARLDLLVIALDVDIAVQARIADPPARGSAYDAKRLCDRVRGWLRGKGKLPKEIVIAIPSMAVESWVLAAFDQRACEKIADPAGRLVELGKLSRNARGKVAKPRAAYEGFARQVGSKLSRVRRGCAEAERLCAKVEARRLSLGGTRP